jgi:hypothetical protein
VVIFITLLAGFIPLLQVTLFVLLEDYLSGLTHCERSAQKLKDHRCDPYHVVSERQVDHGAIVGGEIRSESFHIAGYLLVSVGLSFRQGDRSVLFTVLREGSRSFLTRSDRCKRKKIRSATRAKGRRPSGLGRLHASICPRLEYHHACRTVAGLWPSSP